MTSKMRWMATVCSVGVLAVGCTTTQRIRTETALADALISDEQEQQLGLQVRDELTKQNVKFMTDPEVVSYVGNITQRILPFAKRDRPGVKWQVQVIDDAKTVNAFATPGGYLYVYSGLLLAADTEAEVAGVMAHEAGHVVGRHSARQMVNQYGLQTVAGLALGKNPNQIAAIATQLAGNGVLLAHGRSEETEADEYGARYSSAAGYDPKGLISFFQKLKAQQGPTPKLLTFLSTHPDTGDRMSHLAQYIQQKGLSGADSGADRLAIIKQKIKAGAK